MSLVFAHLFSFLLLLSAAGAAIPAAHAQLPSQSCRLGVAGECPRGQSCVANTDEYGVINAIYGVCRAATLTPLAPTQSSGSRGEDVRLLNPLRGSGNLEEFLLSILDFVIRIGSIVVVLMVIYVGFQFVTARGNETKISKARESLLYTLIGALVLLGAKAIALGIQATIQAISVGN